MIRQSNGMEADPAKWERTRRESAQRYAEKRRAAVVVTRTGQRTTLRRTPRSATKDWSPEVKAAVALRSGGMCEMADCPLPALEIHHRQPRRHGNHRAGNAFHLCSSDHHVRVHGNVAFARERGWIVRSTDSPSAVPIECRYGVVWFNDDGTVSYPVLAESLAGVSGLPEDGAT